MALDGVTRIRVIDLETTGLEPPTDGSAGVCEIGFCDVRGSDGSWQVVGGYPTLINPGCAIPPEASAIHQIVDSDVQIAQSWPEGAHHVLHSPAVTAFAAHQARFERQWLDSLVTLPWICTYKAALRLWPDAPGHSNQTLRHWRQPHGLERSVADVAHRAWPDAYVTASLLRDMLNDGASVEQLIAWTERPALLKRVPFGKHRRELWTDVPRDYLDWVLANIDDNEDVRFTARSELSRRRMKEE